jgi:PadR family transcriptional regulator, regulatory protein PadR
MREGYKNGVESLQGTLDVLILQTLRRGPQHGYGISQEICFGSAEVLEAETGSLSLVPAIASARKAGLVQIRMEIFGTQPARYWLKLAARLPSFAT